MPRGNLSPAQGGERSPEVFPDPPEARLGAPPLGFHGSLYPSNSRIMESIQLARTGPSPKAENKKELRTW